MRSGARSRRQVGALGVAVSALAVAVSALLTGAAVSQPQDAAVPGDPQRGIEVFHAKHCGSCHAVLGQGEGQAPDLSASPPTHLSAAQMAGVMWNHAPAMWERMTAEGIEPPQVSGEEMVDLFSFLYAVRLFDRAGDPQAGRQVIAEKHCLDCHRIGDLGARDGPDLGTEARYANPVLWVQAMWNHAPLMRRRMATAGMPWPELSGDETVDLLAYIRSTAPPAATNVYLLPADPTAGRGLFVEKGCSACHAIRGEGGTVATDLAAAETTFPRTLTQFAGLMWNHVPQMWDAMEAQKVARPRFEEREMADLIAYLYSVRFHDEGDAHAGARVFADKQCNLCHEHGPGPALRGAQAQMSPVALSRAMWNHGPAMFAQMQEKGIPWPRFQGREVNDLIAYLRGGDEP